MSKYEYWHCSDTSKEGFGVKNNAINGYYAGDEVIDLINTLDKEKEEYKAKYMEAMELLHHYREVANDLIKEGW